MNWNDPAIHKIVQLALDEDKARDDVTARTMVPASWRLQAEIRAQQKGIVAGLPLAELFFKSLNRSCRFTPKHRDGDAVSPGQTLAVIEGNARAILAGERPALNAIQHLSGIATQTYENVKRVRGSRTQIFDTRKTLPGWRLLQKYAVRRGGGANHRFSLKDAILIKENHLMISRLGKLDWMEAIHRARKRFKIPVQMEIQSDRDLRDALRLRPDLVLLDNLPMRALRRMIGILRTKLPHVRIEISGGVRTEDLTPLSKLNVERISMGRLTHTVPAFDCNLDIIRVDAK